MPAAVTGCRLGVGVPLSGAWATPANQRRIALLAERLGYHSLWSFSRLLFPLASTEAEWSSEFQPAFHHGVAEPIVTLAQVAAVTERIRLGFSVLNAPFSAPAVLGKQLIELDRVSGGRIDIGLAQGWSQEEFLAAGVPMERRVARTLEYVEVLRRMWEGEVASFKGEFTELPRTLVRPRPVQPRFPLLLGGSTGAAFARAGRLAQGWVSPGFVTRGEIAAAVDGVRAAAERAGRDPAAIRIVVRASVFLGAERPSVRPDGERQLFQGPFEQVVADLGLVRELGASEVFLDFNFDPAIVGPDVESAAALDRVERALTALSPEHSPEQYPGLVPRRTPSGREQHRTTVTGAGSAGR
ncbi:TIGR03619 family F420-dependent LLM class oxidoreductase [Kitasatospora sp. NBC_01287]|uniref:TIGR03619 family F420-dependent LLM class oxidoreductase n=1 Tax=Kitasatospora sp. NBC_01287 TaxID=2903573 RepID=UPI0022568A17|nr:TIGR03619 family F420-dependent LLM class oxidoreductase [Kitasatospora sp. NBC_01287]MCX4750232.1 TIGR03619 family F420-dependent LLM class oxidoreductase [Kitasatospora sp. NBC_01287]